MDSRDEKQEIDLLWPYHKWFSQFGQLVEAALWLDKL